MARRKTKRAIREATDDPLELSGLGREPHEAEMEREQMPPEDPIRALPKTIGEFVEDVRRGRFLSEKK